MSPAIRRATALLRNRYALPARVYDNQSHDWYTLIRYAEPAPELTEDIAIGVDYDELA